MLKIIHSLNNKLCVYDINNNMLTTEIDNGNYMVENLDNRTITKEFTDIYMEEKMDEILKLYDVIYGVDSENLVYSYTYLLDKEHNNINVVASREKLDFNYQLKK